MEKYYTPEIEEFHVGFQYEHYSKKVDFWMPCFYGTMYDQRGDDELDELNMKVERVKYLDREDIESLGFFCHAADERVFHSEKGIIINIGWGSPVKKGITLAIVSPVFDESKMSIVHENYLFNGTIKNKSELKKLLKQLGI